MKHLKNTTEKSASPSTLKKQIFLTPYNLTDPSLSGKTVDKAAYNYDLEDLDKNQFIITFTDGTYVSIGISRRDGYLSTEYILDNKSIVPLESYCPYPDCYVDANGEVHLTHDVRQQIALGVIEPLSTEKIKELLEAEKKRDREREYAQYLRLKAKFENEKNNEVI